MKKICEICGAEFDGRPNMMYCATWCRRRAEKLARRRQNGVLPAEVINELATSETELMKLITPEQQAAWSAFTETLDTPEELFARFSKKPSR